MSAKPTYEELEQRVNELEKENLDRKEMEEALRKEKDFTKSLIDTAQIIVLLLDPKGRIVRFNAYMEDISGYKLEEVQGKDWFSTFLPEQNREQIKGLFRVAVSDIQTRSNINPIVAKDGREIIVEWYDRTLKASDGNTIGLLSIGLDITERKHAEEALRESENKYRNLVEDSFDGIFIQRGQRIIFANKRLNEMLGYNEGELIGQNHWVVYHPEYQELTRSRAQSRMEGDNVVRRYEVKLRRKDGSWFFGEINALPITFPNNKESGIQVWIKNIDENKRAENALKENEAFLKTLIDSIPIPVFYKDKNGKYLGFNRSFETFFGETKERLIGKSVFDINPLELAEIYHAQDEKLLNSESVQSYQSQMKNVHGELRDVIFNKAVFTDSKGAVAGLIGAILDITGLKQAEEALLESENKFSTLFQSSPVYMAFTALDDGCFLDVNDAFTKITGFQRNEVLGRTSVEIGLWFDPEERTKFIKLAQQHGGFHEEEVRFWKKNGEILFGIWSAEKVKLGGVNSLISVLVDITERKKTQEALRKERDKLRTAISEIKTLSGLVPICSHCKNIRDDQGYWNRIEKYIGERSDAQFSHSICPECAKKHYPDLDIYGDAEKPISESKVDT